MKKIISVVLCTLVLSLYSFSLPLFNEGINVGGTFEMDKNTGGGSIEIGFPLYLSKDDSGFLFRNHIELKGKGGEGKGGAYISEKLLIGGFIPKSDSAYKSYGFISFDCGLYGNKENNGLSLCLLTGGGFEIQYSDINAFFIEMGGSYPFTSYLKPSPFIKMGYRAYF